MSSPVTSAAPSKAIPPVRDRMQSRALVYCMVPVLCTLAIDDCWIDVKHGNLHSVVIALAISSVFALLAWFLNAATPAAAACGGIICLLLTSAPPNSSPIHSGLIPLVLLFALTFLATRFGRARKEARGLSEPRTGRRASQVMANLWIAGLCAGVMSHRMVLFAAAIAALAEATADTISSEVGQAIGGPAYLFTTFRRVRPGTDGGISLAGTFAGVAGALVIASSATLLAPSAQPPRLFSVTVAAIAGLFFDSLLGAAVERRGWIGNDLVNLLSTAFAAVIYVVVSSE